MLDDILARLGTLHPKVIDLSLNRVVRLLDRLGRPQDRLPPVVHVAGTNGKGSTIATLRAIAETAGLGVHVYTSPHLVHFTERIRVAGHIISEEHLTELLGRCEAANASEQITFFEITTIAALLAFAETPADLCILETGLGGRLDATNVVERPAATLLSSISMDHEAFLGTTLAAIAGEKAGIIKAGVPCLSALQRAEALRVIETRAESLGSPFLMEGRNWTVTETNLASRLQFTMGERSVDLPLPSLQGRHQIGNAGLAVAAALVLADSDPAFARLRRAGALAGGLSSTDWPARMQCLRRGPLVGLLPAGWEAWLDGGHNPGAGEVLAEVAAGWSDRPVDLVVGMLTSKDSSAFLAPLAPHVRSLQAVAIPDEPNSRTAAETAGLAARLGFEAAAAASVHDAVAKIVARGGAPSRILICGSLYLAGTVLDENG